MVPRSSFPPQRAGLSRIELVVVINLLVLTTLLLTPACRKGHHVGARTQSVNNLKQIGLAAHEFHDMHKRLPFNGCDQDLSDEGGPTYTARARSNNFTSGSWLFQILPFIDQQLLFQLNGNDTTAGFTSLGIYTYMCPGRGRPVFELGTGPWSDYFLNNYLNDPDRAEFPDNPDHQRTFAQITDGTSNTLFAGHGNIATGDYARTNNVPGSSSIFVGGTAGTMRGGTRCVNGTGAHVSVQRDGSTPNPTGWGGPYPQGALLVWCDGTVRIVAYDTTPIVFGAYLTPRGGETVPLPD